MVERTFAVADGHASFAAALCSSRETRRRKSTTTCQKPLLFRVADIHEGARGERALSSRRGNGSTC
jgi:hypothetical protein